MTCSPIHPPRYGCSMARAPWNRPGESPQIRRLRIVMFWTAVVLVVAFVAILVYFVVRSAEIAGL